jgi:hypothetical protein
MSALMHMTFSYYIELWVHVPLVYFNRSNGVLPVVLGAVNVATSSAFNALRGMDEAFTLECSSKASSTSGCHIIRCAVRKTKVAALLCVRLLRCVQS